MTPPVISTKDEASGDQPRRKRRIDDNDKASRRGHFDTRWDRRSAEERCDHQEREQPCECKTNKHHKSLRTLSYFKSPQHGFQQSQELVHYPGLLTETI